MAEKKDELKPQGICPYCGKKIYIGYEKHVLLCKLLKESA